MNLQHNFKIARNEALTSRTFVMHLEGPGELITTPGQFVNIAVEGKFLRRPISVCDYSPGSLTLLYDVVGQGTSAMSQWKAGHEVDMLLPLGNGFDTSKSGSSPLLIGGGIGIAPLFALGKILKKERKEVRAILGYNSAKDIVWADEFIKAGIPTEVCTADGTSGTPGFVTDAETLRSGYGSYFYSCGPLPMLRALCEKCALDGELSLDGRMACGFGVCMCCSLETRKGARRICKDGPVFGKSDLIWK